MDNEYRPLDDTPKQEDPPADANDEQSTQLPDQSVEEFHVVTPTLTSVASFSTTPTEDVYLETGKRTPPNILDDLRRSAAAQDAAGKDKPPVSPTRTKKKRSSKEKRKNRKDPINSKGSSKTKKKDKSKQEEPVTPTTKTKNTPAERDVLLTSVHIKQQDMDTSAGTEMSEITTPLTLRPKKTFQSKIIWESTGNDKIDEVPVSPTEEDLTESTSNVNHTDEKEDTSSDPLKKIRPIPSMTSEHSQQNILMEQVVFAVALPKGPSGLNFKEGYNHAVISGVREKSPLAGIVDPGLVVVGIHLPGDSEEQPSATMTNLGPKKLTRILRQSASQHLRLLWLTKESSEASESFSKSWVTSMSALWRSNDQVRTFAATPNKALVSLPAGDLGISFLGEPPLVYSISPISPLQGLPLPADGGEGKLYVKSLYCAETGDRWDEMDARQLADTLRATSEQQMRILVLTSENTDDDHSDESSSPSFHSAEKPVGKPRDHAVTNGAALKNDNSPEMPRKKRAENVLRKMHSSKRSMNSSIMKIIPAPRHIIIKKCSNPSGRFNFSKVHAFTFHGPFMDKDIAKEVQNRFDRIDCESSHRLTLVQDDVRATCFVATMSTAFQRRHEEDALIAIMDAMANSGWALQCHIDHQGSGRSSETLFIFTK